MSLPKPIAFRPSSANEWMGCPASAVLTTWMETDNEGTTWSTEGTNAHLLAETALRAGKDPMAYVGNVFEGSTSFEVTYEMAEAVKVYTDTASSYVSYVKRMDGECETYVEKRLSKNIKDITLNGTADYVIQSPKRIIVMDLKFGVHNEVEAADNMQLGIYMLAAAERAENKDSLEELIGVIVQPRLFSKKAKAIKTWEVDKPKKWLKGIEDTLNKAVTRVLSQGDTLEYCPSAGTCKWCKGMPFCKALEGQVSIAMQNVHKKAPELPDTFITSLICNLGPIKKFIEEVSKHALKQARGGKAYEGLKLVEGGRAPARTWANETEITEVLDEQILEGKIDADDMYVPYKLKSPAQVEKVLGKAFVKPYAITKNWTRPVILVSKKDKRKNLLSAKEQLIEHLDITSMDFSVDADTDIDI